MKPVGNEFLPKKEKYTMTETHIKRHKNGILVSLAVDECEITGVGIFNFVIESLESHRVIERESDSKLGFYMIKSQ